MSIRLAIQPMFDSGLHGFTARWMEYCQKHGIEHEVVDAYDFTIIDRLRHFDGFLWHFHHAHATDLLMARHVLEAARTLGLVVFPDYSTCWHFDDKIAQKYALEAINAPLARTWVFYDERRALEWLRTAELPVVWKLRRGAGSQNVRLVRSFSEGAQLCRKAFRNGFAPVPAYFADFSSRRRKVNDWKKVANKLQRMPRELLSYYLQRDRIPRESGYALFQEFLPNNPFDTRITVVEERAWGFRRMVRPNDFRASGSGLIQYDHRDIDPECVRIAFRVAKALKAQSIGIDLVFAPDGQPRILEVSYGYVPGLVRDTGGYWDPDLNRHPGNFYPQDAIVIDLIQEIRRRKGDSKSQPYPLESVSADAKCEAR